MNIKPFFGRLGGKSYRIQEITSLFPNIDLYVEPFIGGGSVFLNTRAKQYVINDLDTDIYNMWNDLSKLTKTELNNVQIEKLTKEEFDYIKQYQPTNRLERFENNVMISKNSFAGIRRSYSSKKTINPISVLEKIKRVYHYLKRTKPKILNTDYKTIIKQYDSPTTFFFLDPPYSNSPQDYYSNVVDKNELVKQLQSIKGKFLMTYDYSEENMKLFKDFNIKIVNFHYSTSKQDVKEIIVSNYQIKNIFDIKK
jgi:DNA adenine methylase